MFEKIKNKIEKIKDELDPRKVKIKKEVMKRGIFNIELFSNELGLVIPEVKKELEDLIKDEQIIGYFTFLDTEFITYDYLKEQLNNNIEGIFKLDLKKQSQDFGVPLEIIYKIINDLCSQDIQHGFFDISENYMFFHVSEIEQNQMLSILKKGKVHLSELADFIDDLIESNEDIDLTSLITDIKDDKDSDLNEWEALAKNAIDAALGKKRARIWIDNLISWNKIRGNFTEDQEYFVPQNIITKEISNFIKRTGRVKTSDLQKKFGIKEIDMLKNELNILEKNNVIRGFFTLDETEYVSEEKVFDEIINIINEKNQDVLNIMEIQEKIRLGPKNTSSLLKKLISNQKISGLVSNDESKFFTYQILNKTIMDFIEKNERIKFKTINENFKLPPQDLVKHVEKLIKQHNLRVIVTWDKSEIIKEEKMLFILMDILKKSKKSLLSEVAKSAKIDAKILVRLIKYMLEFGLIHGELTNNEFFLK